MKAAIYSRKSKFTGKGESIENQIQMCKDYASTYLKDKDISEFLVYEDEGFSGGNTNRPEFQRLIEDAKAKKFDVLICYRLDRISRNVADFSTTLEELQKHDIDFISIKEQFDTSTPMGRAMIYIASVFAQLERETIAERVKDNMLELAKTGRWLGGTTPLGYKSKPIAYIDENMNERTLVKLKQSPEELNLVKLIFTKYLEFKSISKLETFLVQNNYKTRKGADFAKNSISVILTNPVYVKTTKEVIDYFEKDGVSVCGEPDGIHGLLTYNKLKSITNSKGRITRAYRNKEDWIAAVSSHKGIIEAKDWIQVQHIIQKNKVTFPNKGKTHNALLSYVLRCGKCGESMQVIHGSLSKTGTRHYYYTCTMKRKSRKMRCDNKNVRTSKLDSVVINKLKELSINKQVFIDELKEQHKNIQHTLSAANREYNLKKAITDKEKQIDNLMNKLAIDDDISDLIIAKIKDIKEEIPKLKKELEQIINGQAKTAEEELNISFVEMMLNKCSIIDMLDVNEQQLLINTLIESATWNSETHEIEINFIGAKESKKK